MQLLMDEQGGEKIELLAELYRLLFEDAVKRKLLRDDYYYLSDNVLWTFENFQGCGPEVEGMSCLEQAVVIWNQSPRSMRDAIPRANGVDDNLPSVQPGEMMIVFE